MSNGSGIVWAQLNFIRILKFTPGTFFVKNQFSRVEFTDGDKADYDGDEIHYVVQLYQREFNT